MRGVAAGDVVFKNGDASESHASRHANCAGKILNGVTAVQSMI
jgi:hypothetical protein